MNCASPDNIQLLYQKTGRAAMSKAAHIVGRWNIAEEIVHDVFATLLTQKIDFHSEKAAFYWIYQSCHNKAIDYLRSAAYRYETSNLVQLHEKAAPENYGHRINNRHDLIKYLRSLSREEAIVLAYKEIDGMSQEETAEIMNISRKTVGRMLKRVDAKIATIKEVAHG